MGLKRKASGDDKLKPDKYQHMDAKSPDGIGAKDVKTKAKIKAGMKAKPEAKARGGTTDEGFMEAIEAAGSSSNQPHNFGPRFIFLYIILLIS
uniref:Uncharacterized protein n=1 Tax=Romanomermis culicivorax TaxID=13658 RepID=A0A915J5A5_ROMCU